MKKVNLKQLTLINFRGHKDLTINFSDQTTISGANRVGKSTISDSFSWLLFGKDQFDRKDFEIIPIIDGKKLDRVDSEVIAVIDYDGREMSIKRVLHQKWVRPRGQSVEKFDGCETLYYINDVPLKASEFKGRIDMMIEETVFKLITNPSAFLSLHWQKQRDFLFQIAGTITDAEVLENMATLTNKDAITNLTNILNSGKSLIEYKKELSARKRKLNDDLANIQPRIDQTAKLMPDSVNFSEIEKQIAAIDLQIAKIDEHIADSSKAIRGQYDEIQTKQGEISALKTKQREVVHAAQQKAQQEYFKAKDLVADSQNKINSAQNKLSSAKRSLEEDRANLQSYEVKINSKNAEASKLRGDWNTENAKEYEAKDGCLICPVFGSECGDPSAVGKHTEAQQIAKDAFFKAKESKLQQIHSEGVAKVNEIKELEKLTESVKTKIVNSEQYVNNCKIELEELQKQTEGQPVLTAPAQVNAFDLLEWKELEAQIKQIESTIQEVAPVDNSELNNKKAELVASRDLLKKNLTDQDLVIRYKAEIARLEKEGSDIAQQIADLEKQEFAIADFTKAKIEECDRRINSLFEIVKFQLFDKTNEGNEFEACIPTNKAGVPISVTNTAERINAGLDIIRTLSNFYNVSAPIFCDGAESVNQYMHTGSQMIFLRVTTEKALTVQ